MSIDFEDDIFQDFLVEAGEILESLGEQLVELENSPADSELLNAIFRGFHTIKGGAGFLNIEAVVDVCHKAEDTFNLLRQGERQVTPELMDAILQVVDSLGEMFASLENAEEPEPADPALLEILKGFALPPGAPGSWEAVHGAGQAESADAQANAVSTPPDPEPATPEPDPEDAFDALLDQAAPPAPQPTDGPEESSEPSDLITDDEFEQVLDQLYGDKAPGEVSPPALKEEDAASSDGDDLITDDEFERVLDQLYGDKAPGEVPPPALEAEKKDEPAGHAGDKGDDLITDDEFEQVLDQLYGDKAPGEVPPPALKAEGDTPSAADEKSPPAETAQSSAPAAAASSAVAQKSKPEKQSAGQKPADKAARKASKKTDSVVRVNTSMLDEIMNLVGELVLVRNHLALLTEKVSNDEVGRAVANLDQVTSDLQTSVMKTRMQPVKKVFGRFPRVVRDLARQLGKEVELVLVGEETDLDKNLVEALADPLIHLVRNAVDHGLESPDEREKKGKSRKGKVVLSAAQEGDHIILRVDDDGKGMDPDFLRRKAVEKGIMSEEEAAGLSDQEAFGIIFMPGFSTKDEISDVSGRGVGMDVVRSKLKALSAQIIIDSQVGKGTSIKIKVPLTLAIMPALMVVVDQQRYALPLSAVHEIFDLDESKINTVDGQDVILVRDLTLPLFRLREWLGHGDTEQPEQQQVVTADVGSRRAGFVVDDLIGQEEIVIKPLGPYVNGLPGFAGASVGGDGRISLIIDIPSLMSHYAA